jgi:DNA-directed RNA polymerase specialized sigma54-like protein
MLKQNLQQKLLQKLSPQQIQFIKLLQVPTVSLDTRIKEELEENPALEDLSLTNLNEPEEQYPDHDPEDDNFNNDEEKGETDEFNIDDYLQEDNVMDRDMTKMGTMRMNVRKYLLQFKTHFLNCFSNNSIFFLYQTKTSG